MFNYRLLIQYDGTDFSGWQIQGAGERTVQSELTRVLTLLDGRPVSINAAGRTDAGVHAEGQVASVFLTKEFAPDKLRAAINGNLPFDVRVTEVQQVDEDFHARFAATGKTYCYRIVNAAVMPPFWRRFALHEARHLNVAHMRRFAPLFVGKLNWMAFASLQTDVRSFERDLTELRIDVAPLSGTNGELISIWVTGEGFLRYLVRGIVGALLAAGRGEIEPAQITTALATGQRPTNCATAAAHGLTLIKVHYD